MDLKLNFVRSEKDLSFKLSVSIERQQIDAKIRPMKRGGPLRWRANGQLKLHGLRASVEISWRPNDGNT